MKALSLYQPWAQLVVIGAKRYETRSWRTNYRGPLLIHASKRFSKEHRQLTTQPQVYNVVAKCAKFRHLGGYPTGKIVGKVVLVECVRTDAIIEEISNQEYLFGNYEPGRWAWQLTEHEEFENPIPAKGSLGIWEFTQPVMEGK